VIEDVGLVVRLVVGVAGDGRRGRERGRGRADVSARDQNQNLSRSELLEG